MEAGPGGLGGSKGGCGEEGWDSTVIHGPGHLLHTMVSHLTPPNHPLMSKADSTCIDFRKCLLDCCENGWQGLISEQLLDRPLLPTNLCLDEDVTFEKVGKNSASFSNFPASPDLACHKLSPNFLPCFY